MSCILFLFLSLLFCLTSVAFAQNSAPAASIAPVQVVYVVDGTTILTYDVDPQTLNSTQVGKPLTVKTASTFGTLVPAAHDHFLYFVAYDANSNEHLWVYQTDSTGAPVAPATQEIDATGFVGLQTDPHAPYAYALFAKPDGTFMDDYYIRRYLINPVTGALSQPKAEAKYVLSNGAEDTTFCYLTLYGFNPSATTLYDAVGCSGHDGGGITYNERSLDSQDGSLGPDAQVYSWTNGNQGENVEFVNDRMFDFVQPNGVQQGVNYVTIFPLVPDTSQPLVHCDASMLEACGTPAERRILRASTCSCGSRRIRFRSIASSQVKKGLWPREATSRTDSRSSVPADHSCTAQRLSLLPYDIDIYGFDATTGPVIPGGVIVPPSNLDSFYVAERD
jgi:hypothetical protein